MSSNDLLRPTNDLSPLIRTGLLLGWLYLAVVGGTWAVISSFEVRLLSQVLLVALLGAWLVLLILRRQRLVTTSIDGCIAALLVAFTLASAYSSSRRLSAEVLLLYAGYALLFLFLVRFVRTRASELVPLLAVTTSIIAIAALAEPVLWYLGLAPNVGYEISWLSVAPAGAWLPPIWPRPGVVTGNPNVLSGYLAPWLPIAALTIFSARTRVRRHSAALWLVLMILALGITVSRGGLIAGGAGLAAFGLAQLATRQRQWVTQHLAGRRRQAMMMAILVALATGLAVLLMPPAGFKGGSAGVRVELWSYAIAMFLRQPLFGLGPDTFGLALLQFLPPGARVEDFLPHAHNLYLGLAAETGVLGLSAALWLGFSVTRTWWRITDGTDDIALPRPLLNGLMAGLASMAVHGLVEDFRVYPALVVQGMVFVALIVGMQKRHALSDRGVPAWWLVMPAALLLLSAAHTTIVRSDLASAGRLIAERHWAEARTVLERARTRDPEMGLYQVQSALATGWVANESDDAMARIANLEAAITTYRAALKAGPFFAANHANLAALLAADGQLSEAVAHLRRVVEQHPNHALYRFNLAVYLEALGDRAGAREQYAASIRYDPNIVRSQAWLRLVPDEETTRLVARTWGELTAEPPLQRSLLRGRIALATDSAHDSADQFRIALDADSSSFQGWLGLGLALHRLMKVDEAEVALRRAVQLAPANASAQAGLAATLLDKGDLAGSSRAARLALFMEPNQNAHLVLARVARSLGQDQIATEHYYAALPRETYDVAYPLTAWRRPGIPSERVPQLTNTEPSRDTALRFEEFAKFLLAQGRIDDSRTVLTRWASYDTISLPKIQAASRLVGAGL